MPSDTYTLIISDAANALPASGSVTNASVAADAAIAFSKLAALTSGNILVGNSSNVPTSVNPSGDVDISDTGVFSIAAGAIVNADVSATAAIALSKLAAGTVAGQIPVVGASPTFTPAYQAISGDATLNGSGVLTVSANAIDSTKLKSDASTDSNRAVTGNHIRDRAISFAKIESATVSGAGGVLVGALGSGSYRSIELNPIFLKDDGSGMLQQITKDSAASAILPSFSGNENRLLGLDSNRVLSWQTAPIGSTVFGPSNGGTGINTYTAGDLLYSDTTNQLAKRAIGDSNNVLQVSGGFPIWGPLNLAASGSVGNSILGEANGGTGFSSLTAIAADVAVTGTYTIKSANGNIETTGSGNLKASGTGKVWSSGSGDIESSSTGKILSSGSGNIESSGSGNIVVSGTGKVGYNTGSGGAVTQTTSRTQTVELNKTNGAITLVSAAGSASWQTFTVTNSTVAATDTVIVNQKSGTDLYMIHVTNVAAGSFKITFATTGGTTTEQPVFNFAIIKAVSA